MTTCLQRVFLFNLNHLKKAPPPVRNRRTGPRPVRRKAFRSPGALLPLSQQPQEHQEFANHSCAFSALFFNSSDDSSHGIARVLLHRHWKRMKHLCPSTSSRAPIASTASMSDSTRPQHLHGGNLFGEEGDTCTVLSFRRPESTPKELRWIYRTNRPTCQSYPICIVQLLRREQTTYHSKDV